MDLRDLRYFETIAELEHVGQAAERLHRTQPALTGAIRRLEKEAGAPLFERAGRGIRLTPAGKVMLRWAQRLRFDVEDAQREVGDIGRGLSGTVRLGIVPTAAQFQLPQAVRRLISEAPEVRLKTTVALVDVLMPMLRAGELDLVVGTQGRPEAGFVSRPLIEDRVVVAASTKHEIFRGTPTLKDLVRYRWVLQPPGAPTRDWLDHTLARRGLPPLDVQVESTTLHLLPALIAETGLLSFVSRRHLDFAIGRYPLREVEIKEATMKRRLVMTHRSNAYLPPAAERIMSLLASE